MDSPSTHGASVSPTGVGLGISSVAARHGHRAGVDGEARGPWVARP